MISPFTWLAVAFAGVIMFLLAFHVTRKEKRDVDFRTFFNLGAIWLAVGVVVEFISLALGRSLSINGLLVMGVIFGLLGFANKSKWDEIEEELTGDQRLVIYGLVVLTALVVGFTYVFGYSRLV